MDDQVIVPVVLKSVGGCVIKKYLPVILPVAGAIVCILGLGLFARRLHVVKKRKTEENSNVTE